MDYPAIKRGIDVVGAALGLLLAGPLLLLLMLAVRLNLGAPVLFRQPRGGLHGSVFAIIKLRTMRDARGADGRLLADEQRLTRLGRLLRATSLDELPELWNVLRGDMSLVGPRPLIADYLDLYTPAQARRHTVRPGLTGWAQVNGRNALSWEARFEQDLWYVDNQSLALDLKILALTVLHLLWPKGIGAEGEATMPRFTGSRESERP